MSSAKTARWLDLVAYLLQHRFPVSREDIYAHVTGYLDKEEDVDPGHQRDQEGEERTPRNETARRMFERDKDELRALGIGIETVPIPDVAGDEPASGYRLRPSAFYLPYLELTEDTARTSRPYPGLARLRVSRADLDILDRATQLVAQRSESPLGESAASARRKLEFDLPLPRSAVERVLAASLGDHGTNALEVLQNAVADKIAVTCSYHSIGRDHVDTRSIEPYGLFFGWGRWYCVARARDRDALRVFRVDRMRDARAEKGKQANFTIPPAFSIQAYVGRAPWELSGGASTLVRVQFSFPESRWVQAQGIGTTIEAMLDDGGAILEFAVQDANPFLRWLLTFRQQAQVLSPASVKADLTELRQRVAMLYAESQP
ncbi:MAG: WYL domain-containing protein [Gemmatimonadota bacterium]